MFKTIVVVSFLGIPSTQLMDQRGPYETMLECASRGHEMMKALINNPPSVVLSMQSFCAEMPKSTPKKGGVMPYEGPTKRL